MKYFIDTNIFLRVLINEDQVSYNNCVSFLEAVRVGKIKAVTANIVLAEIAWVLDSYYHYLKKDVVKSLEGIINLKGLQIVDGYQPLLALSFYEKYSVKYIDTMVVSIKQINSGKWVVVSYDKDFDKLNIRRQEPDEVVRHD